MKSWGVFTIFMYLLISDIFPSLFLFDLYTKTLFCFLFWQITIRALGCELREEEVERIISECSEEGSGKLTFKLFLQIMTQKMVCEPSWSQRRKFLLPNFMMQVATIDWITLVPCRGQTGAFQEFYLSYFRYLPSRELSLLLLPLSVNYRGSRMASSETAASQQQSPSHPRVP